MKSVGRRCSLDVYGYTWNRTSTTAQRNHGALSQCYIDIMRTCHKAVNAMGEPRVPLSTGMRALADETAFNRGTYGVEWDEEGRSHLWEAHATVWCEFVLLLETVTNLCAPVRVTRLRPLWITRTLTSSLRDSDLISEHPWIQYPSKSPQLDHNPQSKSCGSGLCSGGSMAVSVLTN